MRSAMAITVRKDPSASGWQRKRTKATPNLFSEPSISGLLGFGLAALTTVLNVRTDLHLARLHEAITWSRVPTMETLGQLTQRFQSYGSDAQAMALKQLMQITHRQGVVMAFADVFLLLTFLFGGLALAAVVISKPAPITAAPAH
jgi:MFS transporter, DHA2 family, multidrug resistance protein